MALITEDMLTKLQLANLYIEASSRSCVFEVLRRRSYIIEVQWK